MGLAVVSALAGREALAVAHRVRFRLLLVHLELPDIHGLDVVRTLRGAGCHAPFIALTGCEDVRVEAHAMGALRVFDEPFDLSELRGAVARALGLTGVEGAGGGAGLKANGDAHEAAGPGHTHDLSPIAEPRTAGDRWSNFVSRLVISEHDLKTNDDCADYLGVCGWVFSASCRRVNVTASDTRNFARMIRAILRSGPIWIPDLILDIDDARTLRKFEERSGVKRGRKTATPTLAEFFERQQWIPHDNPVLLTFERRVMGFDRTAVEQR